MSTKYWKIIDRLASSLFGYEKHELKFIMNTWENSDPNDDEGLSQKQKDWLDKLDKKYKAKE